MEILTNRELRANLKHYSDRVREGESFQIGETSEDNPTPTLFVNRDIVERIMKRNEILTRYTQLLDSCDVSYEAIVDTLQLEANDTRVINAAFISIKEILDLFHAQDLFETPDFKTLGMSDHQKILYQTFDFDAIGIDSSCETLLDFCTALSMVESALMIKQPILSGVSPITKELLSSVGRFIFGIVIILNPKNSMDALDGMGDDMFAWIETYLTQMRMQTKRIDGVWNFIPVAKGRITFVPDEGEEEYV